MNPIDLVFSTISQMTGGWVDDMTTLCIILIGFEFLLFGFGEIIDVITNSIAKNSASSGFSTSESAVRSAYKDMAYHRGIAWTSDHDKKLDIRLSEIRARNAERRYSQAEDKLYAFGPSSSSLSSSSSNKRDLVPSSSYDDWF